VGCAVAVAAAVGAPLGAAGGDADGATVAAGADVDAGADVAGPCVEAGACVAEVEAESELSDVGPWGAPVDVAAGITDTSEADPDPAVTTVGTSPAADTDRPICRSTAAFGTTIQVRVNVELDVASVAAIPSAAGTTMLAQAVGMFAT